MEKLLTVHAILTSLEITIPTDLEARLLEYGVDVSSL